MTIITQQIVVYILDLIVPNIASYPGVWRGRGKKNAWYTLFCACA